MALNPGSKLGPYEIAAPLGAGGMGEVYRARDTRLDRSVAVKILPAHLANHADAAERFEREARTISSLNHPNVCQLHDVGEQGGVRFLVMELLEGETLAQRLRRGPMPLDQVLRVGAEIAEGLDAAHRRGVVHRDLKPGNVMLTKSGAKLMDFGLAKGMAAAQPVSTELTATMTSSHVTPLTQQGTIVGTFQYMAPEQVEGKEADARSDIFSLGAVLYEMTSGKRAFEGKTLVSVAAAILEKEPEPMKTLQPMTPPALERVIKKCLAKDPDARWQSAGDLASELKWIAEGGGPASPEAAKSTFPAKPRMLPWAVAAVALLAVIGLGILHFASRQSKPVIRTQIASSDKLQFGFVGDQGGPPVISPDGTRIVFAAKAEGKTQLYVRSLDKLAPQPLNGTEDATWPFWSPDGRSIGFFTHDSKLKRIDVAGGPAVVICDALNARGGTWGPDGTVLFEPFPTQPLFRVPAAGGAPAAVTQLSGNYTTHRWPFFLPDGRHYIYLAANHADPNSPDTAIFWASLDGKENKVVVRTHSSAIYAAGQLLYVRDTSLIAQPFDPVSGELKGDATILNDDVQVDGVVWRGTFTAAESGPLIYQPASTGAGLRLTWMERNGKETGVLTGADSSSQKSIGSMTGADVYNQVELSPDGKKAAVTIGNPKSVIWIYDVERNTRTRFTFGDGSAISPLWSHDGRQIAYMSAGADNHYRLLVKASDGSGEAAILAPSEYSVGETQQALWDWSPDGRYLLYGVGRLGRGNGTDIWALPLFGDRKPFAYVAGPNIKEFAKFSPDGRWVAYQSDETGRDEIYVAPFPWTGAKWQISSGSGVSPRWRRDGKEIVFEGLGSPFTWSAQVDGHGSSFTVGEVRTLFESDDLSPNTAAAQFAITPDAQRSLAITTGDAGKLPLTVIQNWTEDLKKK